MLGDMNPITTRRTVDAPVERVWQMSTDIERWPETISGIKSVEVLVDGDFRPGVRWRETRSMFGREETEEMWVTEVDPQRSYTVESDAHGAHYRSTFTFTATSPQQTEVELTFGGEPQTTVARILAKLTGPLASRSVAKALQQDLDDLAEAAEKA